MQYSAKMTDAVIAEIQRQHYDDLKELAKVHQITKGGRAYWRDKDMREKKRDLRGAKNRLIRAWEKIVNAYALVMAVMMVIGLFVWEGKDDGSDD